MQNIDLSFAQDPNTLSLAILYGMIPAIVWLFYWLRENHERPRHSGILVSAFVGGVFMVILALPVEKWIATLSHSDTTLTILWAMAEELLKFLIFAIVILRSSTAIEEPVDYAIYIMVVAFGFAGFENALYLLQPLQAGDTVTLILSGTMRFLGTTLMHAVTASLAGIALGFAYYQSKARKIVGVIGALFLACVIHSYFNLTIVKNDGLDFFQIFGVLWFLTVGVLILFERLRTMSTAEYRKKKIDSAFAGLDVEFTKLLSYGGITNVDDSPISVSFKNKGIQDESNEMKELQSFLSTLRAFYIRHLSAEGADVERVQVSTLKLIPDTVSPRAVTGIISALKAGIIRDNTSVEKK